MTANKITIQDGFVDIDTFCMTYGNQLNFKRRRYRCIYWGNLKCTIKYEKDIKNWPVIRRNTSGESKALLVKM